MKLKSTKFNKKGAVTDGATTFAVTLVTIVIIIAIGGLILGLFRNSQSSVSSSSVTNQSFTVTAGASQNLGITAEYVPNSITNFQAYNGTNITATKIDSSNYTTTFTGFSQSILWNEPKFNATTLNFTFSYQTYAKDAFYNVTTGGSAGLQSFGSLMPVLAVSIVGLILLGLVSKYRREGEE